MSSFRAQDGMTLMEVLMAATVGALWFFFKRSGWL